MKFRTFKKPAVLLTLTLALYLIAATPSQAEAARLYFYPERQELTEGESGVIEMRLDAQGERINAVDISGEINGGSIQVLNFETSDSVLTIFPEAPTVSGRSWNLAGGVPGGFTGDAVIGKLSVVAESLLTEHDNGLGSVDITFLKNSKVFLHGPENKMAAVVFSSGTLEIVGKGGDYLPITSTSHPKQSAWSFEKNFYLSWPTAVGEKYSYKLSRLPDDRPDTLTDLPVGAVKFANLDDGIYYFSLCRLTNAACGTVSRYRAMIDATPPEWKSIAFDKNDQEGNLRPNLSFLAHDKNSGVLRYELSLDGKTFVAATSPFFLPDKFLTKGADGIITLKAWDKAGNYGVTTAKLEKNSDVGAAQIIILAAILLLTLLVVWISIRNKHG